jgi:hypothetical protein
MSSPSSLPCGHPRALEVEYATGPPVRRCPCCGATRVAVVAVGTRSVGRRWRPATISRGLVRWRGPGGRGSLPFDLDNPPAVVEPEATSDPRAPCIPPIHTFPTGALGPCACGEIGSMVVARELGAVPLP